MFKLTDMKATFLLLLLSGTSNHDSLVNIPTLEFLFKLDIFFCNKYDINLLCLVLFYGVCEVDPFQAKLYWKMWSGSTASALKQ